MAFNFFGKASRASASLYGLALGFACFTAVAVSFCKALNWGYLEKSYGSTPKNTSNYSDSVGA